MTKNEARAFINSLIGLRTGATDDLAAAAPAVYPEWRENVDYNKGDRVLYKEILYKVLISHKSQSDWTPDVAPSLFTKILIPDEDVIPAWE